MDEDDFAAVYAATYKPLLGYALRRCDSPEDAADVVAETFTIAWRRAADMPAGDRLWLYGVARRVLANHRRGAVRHSLKTAALRAELPPVQPARGDSAVAEVFRALPDRDREVLALLGCGGPVRRRDRHRAGLLPQHREHPPAPRPPVSPSRERHIISTGSLPVPPRTTVPADSGEGAYATILKCPPGQDACPLRVRLSGPMFRTSGAEIVIGRKAKPGQVYGDTRPARGDHPASLRLTGRTAGRALADLRGRGLTASFTIGDFKAGGSGVMYDPPEGWRPGDGRRITGAWVRSSDSVGLLVAQAEGDPEPQPTG